MSKTFETSPPVPAKAADTARLLASVADGLATEAQVLAERASEHGRLFAYVLSCLPPTDWPAAKSLSERIWNRAMEDDLDFSEPTTTDEEPALVGSLMSAANLALREHLNPARRAEEQRTAPTALRTIDCPDGSRIYTLAPQNVSLLDAVTVVVSVRGHWRRRDDARLVNGDAVCRGCGRAASWQRIDDRAACPAKQPTPTEIRKILTGRPATYTAVTVVPLPAPLGITSQERQFLDDHGLADGQLVA